MTDIFVLWFLSEMIWVISSWVLNCVLKVGPNCRSGGHGLHSDASGHFLLLQIEKIVGAVKSSSQLLPKLTYRVFFYAP
jgi:hypothetical protein